MQIYYGTQYSKIDVTDICIRTLNVDNIITIPMGDHERASFFTDPLNGIEKMIIIFNNDTYTYYDIDTAITINILTKEVSSYSKINSIHSKLKLEFGSFNDELPEQKMVVRNLTGKEKVLEIGGNIGRNTLVIASILEDSANLVTLESDPEIANQLKINKDLNNFNFNIECSALSNRKLMQNGWTTTPSDTLSEGYHWVNTITLVDLKSKYNIDFDTLVLDCEGAFYYILMDMPEILNNINLIIMENDYWDISHKNYIDFILRNNNFRVKYSESGGWGPCSNKFFEVWEKY
jgi:FkbM family methyltransferase